MFRGTRIVSMILRAGFLLALLLGLGFWTEILDGGALKLIHMFLGLVVVGAVWYLGLAQAARGGSLWITVSTFLVGLLLAIIGLTQERMVTGSSHWIIQVVHVLLALLAIGLGEMSAARVRRAAPKPA